MQYALYAMAAFIAAGVLLSVGSIGKPRKPLTPGAGAFVVLTNAGWIVVLIVAAGMLS